MTVLIELDSGNRASLRRLFDHYPCLHGVVAAVIEGGMGRIFAVVPAPTGANGPSSHQGVS